MFFFSFCQNSIVLHQPVCKNKKCFDKHASLKKRKDDPPFILEHFNFQAQRMIFLFFYLFLGYD